MQCTWGTREAWPGARTASPTLGKGRETEVGRKLVPWSPKDSTFLTCSGMPVAGAGSLLWATVSCHDDLGAGHWILEWPQVTRKDSSVATSWAFLGHMPGGRAS